MSRYELVGVERLHIGKLTHMEIRLNYHKYLIEDMSALFREYRDRQLTTIDTAEIGRRVNFLEQTYQEIVGRTFGIIHNTNEGYLDMLLYPL